MENWQKLEINQIGKVVSGGTPDTNNSDFWDGDVDWCTPTDITALKTRFLGKTKRKLTEKGLKKSSATVLPIGSIIVCTRATIGECAINTVKMTTNQGFKNIILKDNFNSDFIYYSVVLNKPELIRLSAGSTFGEVPKTAFEKLKLNVPPIGEQKKIAEILSTWDKAVETTEKLIAAKQKLKKSLMQRLLTGAQRFPEFHGQEWTKYKIADLFEEVARYVKWSDEDLYKLVSIRRRFRGLFPRGDFFGHQIGVKKLKSIHSEDFLISKRQVSHGAWGVVTPEFHDTKVSDEYDSLIVKDKTKINIDFWGWLCKTPQMQRYSYLSSNGVHIEKLIFDFNDFKKRSIYVSSSIEEQKKIAAVLENCDAEINVLQSKLAALRQQKRGLMQKLLTGRVRVKIDEN